MSWKHEDLSSTLQTPVKKLSWCCTVIIPALGKWRWEIPGDYWASQSSLPGNFQASERSWQGKHPKLSSGLPMHVHTYASLYTCTPEHTTTCKHTFIHMKKGIRSYKIKYRIQQKILFQSYLGNGSTKCIPRGRNGLPYCKSSRTFVTRN